MTWAGPESGACVSVLVSWNLEEHAHCCVLCGEDTFQASSIYIYTWGLLGSLGRALPLESAPAIPQCFTGGRQRAQNGFHFALSRMGTVSWG